MIGANHRKFPLREKKERNHLGSRAVLTAEEVNVTGMEPQELGILGSVPGNYRLVFGFFKNDIDSGTFWIRKPKNDSTWVTPTSPWYGNASGCCNNWVWGT